MIFRKSAGSIDSFLVNIEVDDSFIAVARDFIHLEIWYDFVQNKTISIPYLIEIGSVV